MARSGKFGEPDREVRFLVGDWLGRGKGDDGTASIRDHEGFAAVGPFGKSYYAIRPSIHPRTSSNPTSRPLAVNNSHHTTSIPWLIARCTA